MVGTSWADDGEDEIMEMLQQGIDEKKRVERIKLDKWTNEISELYLDNIKEYCQIGLVIFMISQQKTINIFREGKEDREYEASVLMHKIQSYFSNNVPHHEWTKLLHNLCNKYKDIVKGNLLERALATTIDTQKILTNLLLEKTIIRNKKLYMERKGHAPNI